MPPLFIVGALSIRMLACRALSTVIASLLPATASASTRSAVPDGNASEASKRDIASPAAHERTRKPHGSDGLRLGDQEQPARLADVDQLQHRLHVGREVGAREDGEPGAAAAASRVRNVVLVARETARRSSASRKFSIAAPPARRASSVNAIMAVDLRRSRPVAPSVRVLSGLAAPSPGLAPVAADVTETRR